VPTYLGGAFPADVAYPHTVLTDNALAWMAQADQPFLARLSFLEPHTPVFPPPPFDTLYDPDDFRDVQTPAEGRSAFEAQHAAVLRAGTFSARQVQMAQAYYYGLAAWVDSQVGRVLGYLNRAGLQENTIIVFGADHGASMGEGGCWAKQIFAPQVHRVPRLIQWAGTLPAGGRREDVTEGLDLARTLFGLCGVEAPESFEGRDLFSKADPSAVYASIGFGDRRSRAFPNLGVGTFSDTVGWPRRACVRTADYRLDKNVCVNGRAPLREEEDVFLADVREDPMETVNVADDARYREVRDELTRLLGAHIENAVESRMDDVYERRG